jgi:hypothetical protein
MSIYTDRCLPANARICGWFEAQENQSDKMRLLALPT